MNDTMGRISSPLPTTKPTICHHTSTSSSSSFNSPDKLFLRSDCFGLSSFISSCDLSPEVGDLIQIDRVLYTDWALHVGNNRVIHISGVDTDNNEVIPSDTAYVRLSGLSEVSGPSLVRVNNKIVGAKERGLDPLSVEEVIENCYKYLDEEVEFNMLTKNSEHYVTEWKYGQGWSDQAAVTMRVMNTLSSDSTIGHNFLVSSIQAVLNSPGSPSATPLAYSCSPAKH